MSKPLLRFIKSVSPEARAWHSRSLKLPAWFQCAGKVENDCSSERLTFYFPPWDGFSWGPSQAQYQSRLQGLGAGFNSWLSHVLALWPWTRDFCFLNYAMEVIPESTTRTCWKASSWGIRNTRHSVWCACAYMPSRPTCSVWVIGAITYAAILQAAWKEAQRINR